MRPALRLLDGTEDLVSGSDEWGAARNRGVGGSDIPILLGLSKYCTRRELWAYKTRRLARLPVGPAAEWGHLTEPLVADWFARKTGQPVREVKGTVQHPHVDYAIANLDRIAGSEPDEAVLEIKNSRYGTGYGEPGTDQVPFDAAAQVVWYLGVTGMSRGYVAALIGGQDPGVWTIGPDPDLFARLMEIAGDFWRHVVLDEEPALEPHPTTLDLVKRMRPAEEERSVEAPASLYGTLDALKEAREAKDKAALIADHLQAEVCDFMGSATRLVWPGGSISWKQSQGRPSTDWKAISAKLGIPESLIKQHTTRNPYPVFRPTWRNES